MIIVTIVVAVVLVAVRVIQINPLLRSISLFRISSDPLLIHLCLRTPLFLNHTLVFQFYLSSFAFVDDYHLSAMTTTEDCLLVAT
jgi:hypothetical protein